jgi:hypothetical protein
LTAASWRLFGALTEKEGAAMPRITATISGTQREAIYGFLVERLGLLTDLALVVKQGGLRHCRTPRPGIQRGLPTAGDLGWGADDRREVVLTMPPEELAKTLRRLHADADGALSGSPKNGRPAKSRKLSGAETNLS